MLFRRTGSLLPIVFRRPMPKDGGTPPAQSGNSGGGSSGGGGSLSDAQVRDIIRQEGRGNSYRAIRKLASTAAKSREKARIAEEKAAQYEKDGFAPKGMVLLKGDDATAFADVQKYLTESKTDLKTLLENAKAAPELKEFKSKEEKRAKSRDAADEMGWDPDTLAEVIETKGLELQERDIAGRDANNKRIVEKVWCVRKVGSTKDEDWEPVEEHAAENWKLFLPALENGVESSEEETQESAPQSRRQRQSARTQEEGTRFPAQTRSKTPTNAPGAKEVQNKMREEAIQSGIYGGL